MGLSIVASTLTPRRTQLLSGKERGERGAPPPPHFSLFGDVWTRVAAAMTMLAAAAVVDSAATAAATHATAAAAAVTSDGGRGRGGRRPPPSVAVVGHSQLNCGALSVVLGSTPLATFVQASAAIDMLTVGTPDGVMRRRTNNGARPVGATVPLARRPRDVVRLAVVVDGERGGVAKGMAAAAAALAASPVTAVVVATPGSTPAAAAAPPWPSETAAGGRCGGSSGGWRR